MSKLIAARLRRRPARYLLTAIGVAIAVAFGGAVVGQATIAGDRAAHDVLSTASPVVRVTWQGAVTPAIRRQALAALGEPATETLTIGPVRLSGTVVTLAATERAAETGPCLASACPMLLAGASLSKRMLSARGLRIEVAGRTRLGVGGQPVLVTHDVEGLSTISALAALFRTTSWVATLSFARLHSWDLAALEARLRRSEANLIAANSGFAYAAPFDAINAARARAAAAPDRLLLSGGGAIAALATFVLLAAGALRRDLRLELGRLRRAGATQAQLLAFAVGEAAIVCGVAVLAGAIAAFGALAVQSSDAVQHSLVRWAVVGGLLAAWGLTTALLAAVALVPKRAAERLGDAAAVAAVASLALALAQGTGGSSPIVVLLAPLACVAAGVFVFRCAAFALRGAERIARAGSPLVRVALTGLARGPGLASAAIAAIAISIGLGGFALSYRATLERSAADRAAARVPLDVTVAAGQTFATPLQLATLAHWRTLSDGVALPVRRTVASYVSGGASVTVPALGVPSAGLRLLHGWRDSDAPAPLAELARALASDARTLAPALPAGSRWLSLRASSRGLAVQLIADLRDPNGGVTPVPLGAADSSAVLGARIPPGRWQLEALELSEPTGLEITAGHQTAEGGTPPAELSTSVRLSSVALLAADGRRVGAVSLRGWHGVDGAGAVRFTTNGPSAIVRPDQPSDSLPLRVLADPHAAASAGSGRELALSVDGVPVRARVVGIVRRFPTVSSDAAGIVVADSAALGAVLDAAQPGQGQANELWLDTRAPGRLRASLGAGVLAQLSSAFRADLKHELSSDPIARGVLGTLESAAVVGLLLAVIGLLAALLGGGRDARLSQDLLEQGFGPRGLRRELRLRFAIASLVGVTAGTAVGVALVGLAVSGVRAALGPADPPVIAVVPAGALALLAVASLASLTLAGGLGTARQR